ncbi:PH domain-containing protein [Candidatus Woesearchaeota archaeon]|nr:PH domain-containing protein [Candidatus Woesearchaeota archaeon]
MDGEERVLMDLCRSRKAFLVEYGCAGFLLFGLGVLQWEGIAGSAILTRFILAVVVVVILAIEVTRFSHRFIVTNSKVMICDGLIKRSKKHLFLSSITDVDVNQKVSQRLLGYGNLHIKSSSGQILEAKDISNPGQTMERLEELIHRAATELRRG